jgi:hypothetical protein
MHPDPVRSMLGGFVGTVAMTAMMYVVAPILWLLAQIIVMPMTGAGLFSAAMGGIARAHRG